jgi:hypothetical protein
MIQNQQDIQETSTMLPKTVSIIIQLSNAVEIRVSEHNLMYMYQYVTDFILKQYEIFVSSLSLLFYFSYVT